jgi:Reverse transcriptase (RNA-dependent DNA polymerase)
LKNNLFSIYRTEEIYWKQRARLLWLKQDDANIKFFHQIASSNKRTHTIYSLEIDNQPCSDSKVLESYIYSFYKSLLGSKTKTSAYLSAEVWSELENVSPLENEFLTVPFSLDEIHTAVFQMDLNKASNPDRFSMLFYQTFWDLIKDDLLVMFQNFYVDHFDLAHLNRVLICLIPKVKDVIILKNYQPISLLNSSYNFFSKVLTNRLYPILDRLIGPNQWVFLKDRNILDAVVTAHEILHHVKLSKEEGHLLKLDFEKAFDHVDWFYLFPIFQHHGLRVSRARSTIN